jgi:type II secretory pathway pseudopilin PulG
MISLILMISVAVILAVTLGAARQSRQRQNRLERDHRAMQQELERHREVVHSILRELQNP